MSVLPSQNELINENNITQQIIGNNNTLQEQTSNLNFNIVNKSIITLKEGTITDTELVAAEDILDPITAIPIFYKGDTIPEGTEIPSECYVVETEASETAVATDIETGETTDLPADSDVNEGTSATQSGMDRTIDAYLKQEYSTMTEWTFGWGTFKSREGDDLVCLGNLFDDSRQNAIVISSTDPIDPELEAPAIGQYNHIDKFGIDLSKYRITAIAANGNEFIGSFLIAYDNKYVDVNQRIEMFATDIKTGLETVGIHLDGDKSTIKMVGSVELRQHDMTNKDTLSIFDSLDTKRVELTPDRIPSRVEAESGINRADLQFPSQFFTKYAYSEYIEVTRNKNWHNPFVYYYTYNYYLKNFGISISTSMSLGYIEANTMLDLSKLWITLNIPQYLPSGDKLTDHTYYLDPQKVTSIKYTLKKNGKAIHGQTNVELVNNPGVSISGLTTDTFDISFNSTFLDDYNITAAGTYSIELKVNATLQGHRPDYGTKYVNPYIYVNGYMVAGLSTATQPSANNNEDQSARKLIIGTNGLSFTGNNSRYFYAATDGYEMKWDNYGVKLDSTVGLQLNKKFISINDTYSLGAFIDMVRCQYKSGGYTVTLPSAVVYGECRPLVVIGFNSLKVKTQSGDKICQAGSSEITEVTEYTFNADPYAKTFISGNGNWYLV